MVSENTLLQSKNEIKVEETPLKWQSVSLNEVVLKGKRLEASVFDVEGEKARKIIYSGKYPVVMLCGENGLASAYTRGRFKRIWVERSDYPIYQPSTILDIKPIPDGYISKNTKVDIDSLRVSKGQVLLTCSGTIGNVAYVSNTLDNLIFSHDLIRINCKEPFSAGYIYTYLKTYIGNKILTTNTYGSVISHIEAEHLNEVPIPNAPPIIKRNINNLIVRSFALRDASNLLIDKATSILKTELKLPSIDNLRRKDLSVDAFSVKLSGLTGRADASYHVPVVDNIVKHLKKHAEEVAMLGDERISKKVILPGRFKRVYVDEGYGRVFIGGKQIWELDPSNKKYLSVAHHEDRITKQLELHENMTLITCSGTIGKVALVGKHWENWTANQHIIRVIPANKDIAGYLNIFLASDYGYQLITRFTYGSVIDEIDDKQVCQIPIPLLKNKDAQKQINDLALQANEKRHKAYFLEQVALKIMNKDVIFAR